MKIGSISEDHTLEKRVAITPEVAKKFIDIGFEVTLQKNYADQLGVEDKQYENLNVKFIDTEKSVIENSEILAQVNLPSQSFLQHISNKTIIGLLNPYQNQKNLDKIVDQKVNCFSLELLPRITRAQSMDVLSSQANLAGYKAVVESFGNFEKAIPMMMTAAGTVPAAKVLVIGAGVAGLQAIATAKRMGAIVFATDVRMASEQVESLGGKFLTVEELKI